LLAAVRHQAKPMWRESWTSAASAAKGAAQGVAHRLHAADVEC
jgi:hypothetical protein